MPFVCPNSEGIPYHSFCAFATQKVGEGAKPMSIGQCNNSSPDPSIPFSILDLKAQSVRLPVSKGAQILLSEILTWSGERGYCWWGKPAIAKDLNWSVSEVWRRATELKRVGLLEVVPRPGRSNYWVPLPGRNKMERLQKELTPIATPRGPLEKKKETEKKRYTVPDHGTSTRSLPSFPRLTSTLLRSLLQTRPPYPRQPHRHPSFRNRFLPFRLLLDSNRFLTILCPQLSLISPKDAPPSLRTISSSWRRSSASQGIPGAGDISSIWFDT